MFKAAIPLFIIISIFVDFINLFFEVFIIANIYLGISNGLKSFDYGRFKSIRLFI